jgi:hypothetical protein
MFQQRSTNFAPASLTTFDRLPMPSASVPLLATEATGDRLRYTHLSCLMLLSSATPASPAKAEMEHWLANADLQPATPQFSGILSA